MTMTRILFLTWPGAGNQVPALGLAEVLAIAGHEVIFAGYTAQRSLFERAGFGFRVLAESDRDWPAVPPDDWIPVLGGVVWANPNHLVDVPNLL
jgi:hypothetical protein